MPNRMDSMISKGAGKVKGVKARLDGLVGVFKTLAEQHGEVKVLLKRLQDKPEKKPELWPEIRRELLSHVAFPIGAYTKPQVRALARELDLPVHDKPDSQELRVVYPVLRQYVQTRALAEHHDQEATEVENLIEKLDLAQALDWRALYDQLVDTVIHHAEEEEKEIFPKALDAIGDQTAKDLDERFLAAKQHAASAV